MNVKPYDADYLLMKTTDLLEKLLDDDYQKQTYNRISSRVEARFLINDIEKMFMSKSMENYFEKENK